MLCFHLRAVIYDSVELDTTSYRHGSTAFIELILPYIFDVNSVRHYMNWSSIQKIEAPFFWKERKSYNQRINILREDRDVLYTSVTIYLSWCSLRTEACQQIELLIFLWWGWFCKGCSQVIMDSCRCSYYALFHDWTMISTLHGTGGVLDWFRDISFHAIHMTYFLNSKWSTFS